MLPPLAVDDDAQGNGAKILFECICLRLGCLVIAYGCGCGCGFYGILTICFDVGFGQHLLDDEPSSSPPSSLGKVAAR